MISIKKLDSLQVMLTYDSKSNIIYNILSDVTDKENDIRRDAKYFNYSNILNKGRLEFSNERFDKIATILEVTEEDQQNQRTYNAAIRKYENPQGIISIRRTTLVRKAKMPKDVKTFLEEQNLQSICFKPKHIEEIVNQYLHKL